MVAHSFVDVPSSSPSSLSSRVASSRVLVEFNAAGATAREQPTKREVTRRHTDNRRNVRRHTRGAHALAQPLDRSAGCDSTGLTVGMAQCQRRNRISPICSPARIIPCASSHPVVAVIHPPRSPVLTSLLFFASSSASSRLVSLRSQLHSPPSPWASVHPHQTTINNKHNERRRRQHQCLLQPHPSQPRNQTHQLRNIPHDRKMGECGTDRT
jgi:hypothetical protein